MENKKILVKLVRSTNKCLAEHKACVTGLGLRKIGQTRTFERATPEICGMIRKAGYLLQVKELD